MAYYIYCLVTAESWGMWGTKRRFHSPSTLIPRFDG